MHAFRFPSNLRYSPCCTCPLPAATIHGMARPSFSQPRMQRLVSTRLNARGQRKGEESGSKDSEGMAVGDPVGTPDGPAGPKLLRVKRHKGYFIGEMKSQGRRIYKPYYKRPAEAAKAVDWYIRKIKGPGARTNYPLSAEEAARVDALSLDKIEAMFREEAQRRKSSPFLGVSPAGVKWQAQIYIPEVEQLRKRKMMRLGTFEDERRAAYAYDAAAWELRGRDATLNLADEYAATGLGPTSLESVIPNPKLLAKFEAELKDYKACMAILKAQQQQEALERTQRLSTQQDAQGKEIDPSDLINVYPHHGLLQGQVENRGLVYRTSSYRNPVDAAKAADVLIRKIRGPDAPTNFIFSPTDAAAVDALSLDEVVAKYCQPDRPGRTSNFKGVSWNKNQQKWQAGITLWDITTKRESKSMRLGYFEDENAAAYGYDAAAWFFWGSEAPYLNFAQQYDSQGSVPPSIDDALPSRRQREKLLRIAADLHREYWRGDCLA